MPLTDEQIQARIDAAFAVKTAKNAEFIKRRDEYNDLVNRLSTSIAEIEGGRIPAVEEQYKEGLLTTQERDARIRELRADKIEMQAQKDEAQKTFIDVQNALAKEAAAADGRAKEYQELLDTRALPVKEVAEPA